HRRRGHRRGGGAGAGARLRRMVQDGCGRHSARRQALPALRRLGVRQRSGHDGRLGRLGLVPRGGAGGAARAAAVRARAPGGQAPYRAVLTHGFVMDEQGRKMSKSLGNVVEPQKVVDQLGADILRLWAASVDYRGDVRISDNILRQLAEVYRRIRNTARFLLGTTFDFDPARDAVPLERMRPIDRWAVLRVRELSRRAQKAYADFDYHVVFHQVQDFCAVDMGGFYLDALKDRLYCHGAASPERRSAQTALWEILITLTKLIAPVLAFTADEIWQHLPEHAREQPSVHLTTWD